jgi:hypothetical protein
MAPYRPRMRIHLALIAALASSTTAAAAPSKADLAKAPGYTTTRTGGQHDFDFIHGAWTTVQHRLKTRGVGSKEWEDFPATLCATGHLDGIVNADELWMPTRDWAGFTVRTFDLEKKQWQIYWVSSKRGRLDPGVAGGFTGDVGEFYGEDTDDGRPVVVRYRWTKKGKDHARWEQAFSYDGKTWETNWTADFTRADPAKICVEGRPKR